MAILVQRHTSVSKQATLLDGLDVSPLKWCACGCGLNRLVHEGMNHISNVKVHSKTRSGNVNIAFCAIVFGAIFSVLLPIDAVVFVAIAFDAIDLVLLPLVLLHFVLFSLMLLPSMVLPLLLLSLLALHLVL